MAPVPRLPYPLRDPLGDLADFLLQSLQRPLDPPDTVAIPRLPRLGNPVQVLAALGPRYVVRPDPTVQGGLAIRFRFPRFSP